MDVHVKGSGSDLVGELFLRWDSGIMHFSQALMYSACLPKFNKRKALLSHEYVEYLCQCVYSVLYKYNIDQYATAHISR